MLDFECRELSSHYSSQNRHRILSSFPPPPHSSVGGWCFAARQNQAADPGRGLRLRHQCARVPFICHDSRSSSLCETGFSHAAIKSPRFPQWEYQLFTVPVSLWHPLTRQAVFSDRLLECSPLFRSHGFLVIPIQTGEVSEKASVQSAHRGPSLFPTSKPVRFALHTCPRRQHSIAVQPAGMSALNK
jgi:hypothetical protein